MKITKKIGSNQGVREEYEMVRLCVWSILSLKIRSNLRAAQRLQPQFQSGFGLTLHFVVSAGRKQRVIFMPMTDV